MMHALLLLPVALFASPAAAQDHSAHQRERRADGVDARAEMDHCAMGHMLPHQCPSAEEAAERESEDPLAHGAMGHGVPERSVPTAAPESSVPPRAFDGPRHAADAIWGEETMAQSRRQLARENGGMKTGMVLVERMEMRFPANGGGDGYVWDAQGWYGGDLSRFVVKAEGEGEYGGALEEAELQALYSRAISPFFDMQAGLRFDPEPVSRSHAVIGIQGLAPYMFHVDGALYLSDRGDLTARIEGEYDQRITQRLILQPRLEVAFSAQDIPGGHLGSGVTRIESGLRLRYEFARELAPYIGLEYEARLGETADFVRAEGEDPEGLSILVGLRAWF
jgi:copper resistance protein B